LQDDGLDTFDATPHSASMTMSAITASPHTCSGCCTARGSLLTNNRAKLYGLTKAGIEIAGRMPLEAPINADNRRYMTAKAARAGHRFDHLTASLADQS